ncbi:MAG: endopeptidase La [Lachnospiraceae bacterium]|nr:endopeptidase La [Lachnospiraceae bacterium]
MNNQNLLFPAVPLRGITILPGNVAHFDVSRERSIEALNDAMMGEQKVFLITQRDTQVEEPGIEDLYEVGTIAMAKQVIRMQGGSVRVLVEGLRKARLMHLQTSGHYLRAEVEEIERADSFGYDPIVVSGMVRSLTETFSHYANANKRLGKDFIDRVMTEPDILRVIELIIGGVPFQYTDKQRLLEAETLEQQYGIVQQLLSQETVVMEVKDQLQRRVRDKVEKNQKDYILREEMKLIRKELDEDEEGNGEDELKTQIEQLDAPDYVKKKLNKELKRMNNLPSSSSESAVLRSYIETALDLPWNHYSQDRLDIQLAEDILNEDHYGLEKVKERMLEFLAVRALTEDAGSQIICLAGPPGTGKTSIVKSIAKALNREYVRISLGGVRDEAEIRGHRKTYVGAMPGRIINALKQAKVSNPVILLDEIDKVSSDHKGDTASALLEVLDGEQNCNFVDHYMEIPVDLSKVFFVATANDTSQIPRPLLDRMEVIEVNSYTENEKFHIAKEHLVRKQREKNGLKASQFSINDAALETLIHSYTREAGVRNLERKIGALCRKAAKSVLMKEKKSVKVTPRNIKEYLGKELFVFDAANEKPDVGIVRGLAWTAVGGDTLEIEVNTTKGKGDLVLTGKLGDVMKESARVALSAVRFLAEKYGVEDTFFHENDIHIHIPEGAVPKDGPSAGVTMATAMLSAVTGKKVNPRVAMTGEISIRGGILPIGGLKEKLLAANKAGITTVCVPKKNKRDMDEISKEIIGTMKVVYITTLEDAVKQAFHLD